MVIRMTEEKEVKKMKVILKKACLLPEDF